VLFQRFSLLEGYPCFFREFPCVILRVFFGFWSVVEVFRAFSRFSCVTLRVSRAFCSVVEVLLCFFRGFSVLFPQL
jgi:hypothetical protein